LSIRQAPFIRFQFDEQLKKELEILEVLDRLRIEREEKEARDGAAQEAAAPPPNAAEPGAREQKEAVDRADPSEQQSPT
jgi:hypothetical protein